MLNVYIMRKSCCIDDANFTPNSSCPMVLRSACIHGHHSHNSLDTHKSESQVVDCLNKKCPIQSPTEKEHNSEFCEKSVKIETSFHSSLKQFAYKSAKTYSILKESIYNHLDYSNKLKNKSTNEKETSSESIGDLYSLSHSEGLIVNNNSIIKGECCHINNNCTSSNHTNMSKSRDFSRSSVASVNALSDSENEESFSRASLRKRQAKRLISSKSCSGNTDSSNNHSNHNSHSINDATSTYETTLQSSYEAGSNYNTPTSSILYRSNNNHSYGSDISSSSSLLSPALIDISNVQYTIIDRFRWFLWKSIYMKIIRCVNFDVWLLSRLCSYRKSLLLLLLIPLLIIYLLSVAGTDSKNCIALGDINSKVYDFSSYIYDIITSPFSHQKIAVSDFTAAESSTCSKTAYDVISAISFAPWYHFLTLYSNIKGVFTNDNKEDLKLMALEIKRLKDDVVKMKDSRFKDIPVVKDNNVNNLLVSDIASLSLEFQSLAESVKKLEKDISQKSEGSPKYASIVVDHNSHIISINAKMKSLEDKISDFSIALKNCCDQKWTLADFTMNFEKYFLAALKTVVEGDKSSLYFFFNEWLQTKLSADKEVLSHLKSEFEEMKAAGAKYDDKAIENIVKKHMDTLRKDFSMLSKVELSGGAFSIDVVQKLIRKAILLYDADKTGKVDYALESGGGSVLSTRCSESYAEKDGTISVLGLPLWSTHSSPRTAIQPDMQPGQCWAFKGSQGFLVIQLSYTIMVTGFTLEHIPLSLSPSGSIDSAPKDFSVWGLNSEKDNGGKMLGQYSFDQYGDSLQYFPVQNVHAEAFSFVELKILSNWGNLEYTCLYRFRVHGIQPKH